MDSQKTIGSPYIFGLEHVPLPAIACDLKGKISWANHHFLELMKIGELPPDASLFQLIQFSHDTATAVHLDQLSRDETMPESIAIDGHRYTIYITSIGKLFGCVFAPEQKDDWVRSPEPIIKNKPATTAPTGNKLLEAFIFLSRELNLTMREDELIKLFVQTYEDLFANRFICIRLVNTENLSLAQVYANGRLREGVRNVIQLTKSTCAEHGLEEKDTEHLFGDGKIRTQEGYETIFFDAQDGFDVPLFDGTTFYGVINFEYAHTNSIMDVDRLMVRPLAHQMCAALRNARLLAETILLKDYSESLLDQANAPMVVVSREGKIATINQAFERLTGYDRQEVLGINFTSLIPEADRMQTRTLSAWLKAIRGERVSNLELRIPHADGKTTAHIVFNIASLKSSVGEPEWAILVGQDLTEIKALENQIIHSEKLATLGQVAAGVAHELNNPLTSITVYASYLKKKLNEDIDESDLEKIDRIVQAATRIQKFSRDLVTYARPSGEKPTLIDITEVVEHSLSFCEHFIEKANAEIAFKVEDGIQQMYGIRGQLEQVFVNLITNACHALTGENDEIRVTVSPTENGRVKITLADSGHGIPQDKVDRIFEPFFSTKPEGKGTGLGLSIVRNILLNHNAEIQVESKLGKGTTFTISI
jgi:two-component system NtrC family sensor kinase